MASPNYDPFHLQVIYCIGDRGGQVDMSALGLDVAVKQQFASLNLAKRHKMSGIIDLRPDLFERTVGRNGGPAVKLTEAAMNVLNTNELPPPDPTAQRKMAASAPTAAPTPGVKGSSSNIRALGVEMPPEPANALDATQARKYFWTTLVRVLGATPTQTLTCSECGTIQEIRTAWTAGTLHQNYKMIDIMRERPDLLQVKMNEAGRERVVTITNKGRMYAPGFEIPEPDASCPPPFAPKDPSQRKYPATRVGSAPRNSHSIAGYDFGAGRARSRSPRRDTSSYGAPHPWSLPTSYGASAYGASAYGASAYGASAYGPGSSW